jgi:hypothetical protein
MKRAGIIFVAAVWLLVLFASASALEINPKVGVEGDLVGLFQYQNVSRAPDADDKSRGAVVFQPALGIDLTENDRVFAKFGFAAGNALNLVSPFVQAPWAADLEQDVKGINGRDRDYLLTAWYRRTIDLAAFGSLALSGGIIDATDYLDQNAYANDEFTQFMNSALVNASNAFLPSYDKGAAAEWQSGNWSLNAVYMGIGGNEGMPSFNFYGAQVGYRLPLSIGEGNYRINVNGTGDAFESPTGSYRSIYSILISCDQQIGENLGAWVRVGRQDDGAWIDYEYLFSGGIDLSGRLWSRDRDNIGIGMAYMNGGNSDIDSSTVLEFYYRWAINEIAALTFDFQYMRDNLTAGDDPRGWIGGLRFAACF